MEMRRTSQQTSSCQYIPVLWIDIQPFIQTKQLNHKTFLVLFSGVQTAYIVGFVR